MLAAARDLALIYFFVITIAVMLAPGLGFYFAVRGVRKLRPSVVHWLRQSSAWLTRASLLVEQASLAVARPIIATTSVTARAQYHFQQVMDWLTGH